MKKKSTKPTIKIPTDKQEKFNELMDKYMDTHNMSGESAYNRAVDEMGLSPRKLHEGMRKAMRRIKANDIDYAEKEAMRQGFRKGKKDAMLDRYKNFKQSGISILSDEEKNRLEAGSRANKHNIQKLAIGLYPNIPGDRFEGQKKASAKDRRELKDMAKTVTNRTTASEMANDIYNEQPVVQSKKDKTKEMYDKLTHLHFMKKLKQKGFA
jgi:hypothetical protein